MAQKEWFEFWAISKSDAYAAYDMLARVIVSYDDFLNHLIIPPVSIL